MSLIETAEKFSRFCRTGELDPALNLNPERAQTYYKHTRSRVESALRRAYPLTFHLLKSKRWEKLVDSFLRDVECTTPYFWRMPQSLVDYVKKNHLADRFKIPYLDDLVDFEWIELEIFMMPDAPTKIGRQKGNLLEDPLILNPESCILTYSYPVYEKKKLPRLMQKGTYPLLAFRHPDTGQVHFIALSSFFKTLLELIQQRNLSGREALIQVAKKFNFQENQVMPIGEKFLQDLYEKQAIYGSFHGSRNINNFC